MVEYIIILCPECGHEYDFGKNLRIPVKEIDSQIKGRGKVKVAVHCKCGCDFNIEVSRPTVRYRWFFKKLGGLRIEVKKRANPKA